MDPSSVALVNPSAAGYDPFARGPFPVGVRTLDARDGARERMFRCEVWYPAAARRFLKADIAAELARRGVQADVR